MKTLQYNMKINVMSVKIDNKLSKSSLLIFHIADMIKFSYYNRKKYRTKINMENRRPPMRFKKLLSTLLLTAIVASAVPAKATKIPEFLYDSKSSVEIKGVVEKMYEGRLVTILITDEDGDIAHIGEAKVKADGTYSHKFAIDEASEEYSLRVNVRGELIDDSIISAIKKAERVSIDIDIAENMGVAEVTASIADHFGLYDGGVSYSIILAAYAEDGTLTGVIDMGSGHSSAYAEENATLGGVIPEGTAQLKAIIIDGYRSLEPLNDAKQYGVIPADQPDTYNLRGSEWETIGMINDDLRAKDVTIGGEGCQRIMSLAISEDDQLMFSGNDTGGLNRSTDGGKTWEDVLRGFHPGGSSSIVIDPTNKNRVIAEGHTQTSTSSLSTPVTNGLYLSEDAGYTWKQVLSQPSSASMFDTREALAFDRSSYSEAVGGCSVAYWSRAWRLQGDCYVPLDETAVVATETDKAGLWKTTDGGKTWKVVNSKMSDGVVKVHPEGKAVYVANVDGFHVSYDGGKTFKTVLSGRMILGLDVVATEGYEDYVWVVDGEGVWKSTDCGATFTEISNRNFPDTTAWFFPEHVGNAVDGDADKIVRQLKVSPVNPDNMVVAWYNGANYKNAKYYSTDGGVNFKKATEDASLDFMKNNNRHPMFVWSNKDANKVWSIGGDWVTLSTNGGATYKWHYDGGADVHVDQRTIFNIFNPDIFYYGSQDFHGALTTDGGRNWKKIWKFVNVNSIGSEYAGFVYGSYAAWKDADSDGTVDNNELTLLAVARESDSRWLYISRDAGETWERKVQVTAGTGDAKYAEMCYQAPNNPDVLFVRHLRSADYGKTWSSSGVTAVCAHDDEGNLYGVAGDKIYKSTDNGASWTLYCQTQHPGYSSSESQVWDIAYDSTNDFMYYVTGNGGSGTYFGMYVDGVHTDLTANLNTSNRGGTFQLVAVDPNHPNVVYVGGYANAWNNEIGVQRSTDYGRTFQVLTTNNTNSIVKTGPAGGLEAYDIIVHPETSEIWVAQGINGWAKFPSPYLAN